MHIINLFFKKTFFRLRLIEDQIITKRDWQYVSLVFYFNFIVNFLLEGKLHEESGYGRDGK